MRLRSSYLCGDHAAIKGFQSLAEAASQVLTDVQELANHSFADDLCDLFRTPRGGIRHVYGDVPNPPHVFVARGWDVGVLRYQHGVLLDVPLAESPPGVGHWLVFLHRLSWRRVPGSPLRGSRLAWHKNTTVPYEWVIQKEFDPGVPKQWRDRFTEIPTTSYYSTLGEHEHPLDVNLASAFGIDLILSAPTPKSNSASASTNIQPTGDAPEFPKVDYSGEEWSRLTSATRFPPTRWEVARPP